MHLTNSAPMLYTLPAHAKKARVRIDSLNWTLRHIAATRLYSGFFASVRHFFMAALTGEPQGSQAKLTAVSTCLSTLSWAATLLTGGSSPKHQSNLDTAMTSASTRTPAPIVSAFDGHATTTSKDVADYFGKRHAHVLRTIENLLADLAPRYQPNFGRMFIEAEIGNGATRQDPAYRLTFDGFILLVMGFTGKKALACKLAYIDAFNEMRARLLPNSETPARLSSSEKQKLREAVNQLARATGRTHQSLYLRLHSHFQVTSYHELPAGCLDEALRVLRASNTTQSTSNASRHVVGVTATFSYSDGSQDSRELASNEFITNGKGWAKLVGSYAGNFVPIAELPAIIAAASKRLEQHITNDSDLIIKLQEESQGKSHRKQFPITETSR